MQMPQCSNQECPVRVQNKHVSLTSSYHCHHTVTCRVAIPMPLVSGLGDLITHCYTTWFRRNPVANPKLYPPRRLRLVVVRSASRYGGVGRALSSKTMATACVRTNQRPWFKYRKPSEGSPPSLHARWRIRLGPWKRISCPLRDMASVRRGGQSTASRPRRCSSCPIQTWPFNRRSRLARSLRCCVTVATKEASRIEENAGCGKCGWYCGRLNG
jgi:hypothetical protein